MTQAHHFSRQASGLALPLAIGYCGLVLYASLYPFVGWQSKGVMPWAFVMAPLSHYWTGFDVTINVLGYIPLGFLVTVQYLNWYPFSSKSKAVFSATLLACALSFCMEALQTYLPSRVSSNVDWVTNTFGGLLGGVLAWIADSIGLLRGWSNWRERRFVAGSGAALVLLLLWPLALVYPTFIPFGLGHILGPWLGIDHQPLTSKLAVVVLGVGLLVPILMAYAVTRRFSHRVFALVVIVLTALGMTTISNGLSFGPEHAMAWLHTQSLLGLWLGIGSGVLLLSVTNRLCWIATFFILVPQLTLVNLMTQDPYFLQTLMIWERGQFIRFYGATQWLGWLWPYAVLLLAMMHLMQRYKS